MPNIISHVIEECQHGCADELGAVLHEGLGVDAFHQHLETADGYTDVGTEGCESDRGQI